MYLICRRLGMSRTGSLIAAGLLGLENLTFVQTSIAMLDVYGLFFMFLAFWLYLRGSYPWAAVAGTLATLCKLFGGLIFVVIGLHWLLVKPEGLHLNSPDPPVRRRTGDYLRAEIDFCTDLGGSLLVVGSPRQRNVPEGETYEQVWERSVATFRALAEHAAGRSVLLCIEPLGAQETNFICTAAEARRLVEAVDRPAFRMMLDVKAMCQDEEPIPDIIRRSAPYLDHVHANDASRQGPGFGATDFRPIAAAL